MTAIQTNMENQSERFLPPVANGSEVYTQPSIHGDAEAGLGVAALATVELPNEVHQLVVEDVNPDQHVRTSLVNRFTSRFIKRKMGQIEKDLNREHMELAQKQKVRPSVLQREHINMQPIVSDPSDLPQRATKLRQEVFAEEPDQFDQKLAHANKKLAHPTASGAAKPSKSIEPQTLRSHQLHRQK